MCFGLKKTVIVGLREQKLTKRTAHAKAKKKAETAVGTLTLSNIAFDTTLAGFADFNGVATNQQLSVTGASTDYILVALIVQMTNPSQISILLGTINFDVLTNSGNATIGKLYLNDLTITPGTQSYFVEMHLGDGATGQSAVSSVLTSYLTNQAVELNIHGSTTSTDIEPLQPGLEQVLLSVTMQGIQANLVNSMVAVIDPAGTTALATISIYNPLDTPFSIASVTATTSYKSVCAQTSIPIGEFISVGEISLGLSGTDTTIQPKSSRDFDNWLVTDIYLLNASIKVYDPYAAISINQVVVTVVNEAYNTERVYGYMVYN